MGPDEAATSAAVKRKEGSSPEMNEEGPTASQFEEIGYTAMQLIYFDKVPSFAADAVYRLRLSASPRP